MRLHIAVPEGYKKRSLISSFDTYDGSSAATHYQGTGYRVLVPQCGILKVGAHEAHGMPEESDVPALQFNDRNGLSSQDSSVPDPESLTVPVPVCSNSKRQCEEEDKEDEGTVF